MTIQPPSSVNGCTKHSDCMNNDGGCIVTNTSELLETWASAYKRIMTDVPSHSGLYKPSVCTHVSLNAIPCKYASWRAGNMRYEKYEKADQTRLHPCYLLPLAQFIFCLLIQCTSHQLSPYRFYVGHTPVLVVGNPEMVKEITIKQSANFMDRSVCLHGLHMYIRYSSSIMTSLTLVLTAPHTYCT